jgi:hypothetical protein
LNLKEKKALLLDIKIAKSHISKRFQKYSVLSDKEQNEEQETESALVSSLILFILKTTESNSFYIIY